MITKETKQALTEAKDMTKKFSVEQIHTIFGYLHGFLEALD